MTTSSTEHRLTVRASDEAGHTTDNPSSDDILRMVDALGPKNTYLLIEKFSPSESSFGLDGFAQTATPLPDSDEWAVEYRKGTEHFQAFTKDREKAKAFLVAYNKGDSDWEEQFDWALLMTHDG